MLDHNRLEMDVTLQGWEMTLAVGNRTSPVGCYLFKDAIYSRMLSIQEMAKDLTGLGKETTGLVLSRPVGYFPSTADTWS